jgi:hypothetical protein
VRRLVEDLGLDLGDELGDTAGDYKGALARAHGIYRALRAGPGVENVERGTVTFSGTGEHKTFSGIGPEKLQLIAGLEAIVRNGRALAPPQAERDPRKRGNVRAWHLMGTKVRLGRPGVPRARGRERHLPLRPELR